MPLIFVGQQETDEGWANSMVPDDIAEAYRTGTWPSPGSGLLATVPVGGQLVAYAQSESPDDTSVATRSITFDVEVPGASLYDKLPPRQPRFLPVMRSAQLDVPSCRRSPGRVQPQPSATTPRTCTTASGRPTAARCSLPGRGLAAAGARRAVQQEVRAIGRSGRPRPVAQRPVPAQRSGLRRHRPRGGRHDGSERVVRRRPRRRQAIRRPEPGRHRQGIGFDQLDKLPRLAGGAMDQVQKLVADMERLHTLLEGYPARSSRISGSGSTSWWTRRTGRSRRCSRRAIALPSCRTSSSCRRSWRTSPAPSRRPGRAPARLPC